LKITEKVSFNIASEASYIYIFSGQKLIKNAKNGQFWQVLEKLKLAVKQCYQTGQFLNRTKIGRKCHNSKIRKEFNKRKRVNKKVSIFQNAGQLMEEFEEVHLLYNQARRSHAWNHYLRSNLRPVVKCKHCNNLFQYTPGQSTSNLTRHLRLQHQIDK